MWLELNQLNSGVFLFFPLELMNSGFLSGDTEEGESMYVYEYECMYVYIVEAAGNL